MNKTKTIICILLVLFLLLCIIMLSSCAKNKSQNPALYSSSLIVVPNAKKVKYLKLHGTDQVYYQLREQYPAANTIKEICNQLQQAGWQPLPEDILNPGLSSSLARGWSEYIDRNRNLEVYQWLADWKDKQNNSVRFVFKYTSPVKKLKPNEYQFQDNQKLSQLNVIGIYTPALLEKSMEDWARSVGNKSETALAFEQATTEAYFPVNQLSMDIFAFQRDRAKWPGSIEELRIFAFAHNLPIDLTRFDRLSFQLDEGGGFLSVNFTLKEYKKKITWKNGMPEIIRIEPIQGRFVFDPELSRNYQAEYEEPPTKPTLFDEISAYRRVKSKWPTTFAELQQFVDERKESLDISQYANILFSEEKDGTLMVECIFKEKGKKNFSDHENIGAFGTFTTQLNVPNREILHIAPPRN